ncbi:DUF2975 domain-containing protein [Flavobacterium sp. MFBS3-15]|uniref:DUF2975 domain-containing protein n=1 Tax=Flavobacterium sp. MFBS3-15 TaxID=2989816 RepID=UPI0022362EED|nr:DUF2975 domain-containing protein [Flavobacterium sp. MFBS3-15]MCW4470310.1 DUF2975 domain-containing protein [Flavobacterium sp. MFBS3-15]
MKRLPLLQLLTNILFILVMVIIIFGIPCLAIAIIAPDNIPFTINGIAAEDWGADGYIVFVSKLLTAGFWAYALYLFKTVLGHFKKQQVFHDKVIVLLDQTGKAILIGFCFDVVPEFLYDAIRFGDLNFEMNTYTFFVLMLGLFFIVLSEVFLVAKGLKEENDLNV